MTTIVVVRRQKVKYTDLRVVLKQPTLFEEGITKCSNKINNKLISARQHNKHLLEYTVV